MDATLIGKKLGSYTLLEHLGSGGVASVYRARDERSGKDYAFKMLQGEVDREMIDRFGRESVALSRLRHHNVVSVVDFGMTDDKLPFLVMEHVPGRTLAQLIADEAPLSLKRVAAIGRGIAAGLDEAHCLGFVHRDVKPSNVMVSVDESGEEIVKLLDFGVVGLAQASMTKQLTLNRMILGTPKYMSPEQAAGETPSFASDLYALGLVMYEMLVGRPAFVADSVSALMLKQISEMPAPLPACGGLEHTINRLLSKSPEERHNDADELVRDLDHLAAQLPSGTADVPEPTPDPMEEAEHLQSVDLPVMMEPPAETLVQRPMIEPAITDVPMEALQPPRPKFWARLAAGFAVIMIAQLAIILFLLLR